MKQDGGEDGRPTPPIRSVEVDQGRTGERAADVIGRMKRMFSDVKYAEAGKTLDVRWLPTLRFVACAGPEETDPSRHAILLSSGVPLLLNRDAVGIARLAADHFTLPQFSESFRFFDYGGGPGSVLPPELDKAGAADHIFRLAMAWLYLHEQAHLFQDHVALAEDSATVRLAGEPGILRVIDECASHSSGRPLTGRAAALSHVLELAADAEASNRAGELLIATSGHTLARHGLWALVCALMCVFQRFYGPGPRRLTAHPEGSHPDPSYRMRLAIRELREFAMDERVRPMAP